MSSLKSAIPLHRTCQQAAHLMISAEDRPLHWRDKVALKIHLWMCKNCPRVEIVFINCFVDTSSKTLNAAYYFHMVPDTDTANVVRESDVTEGGGENDQD